MLKVTEYVNAAKSGRVGYKVFKIDLGEGAYTERELAYLLPPDNMLDLITYDPEILERAVIERRFANEKRYPSPDEIAAINDDYQNQCRIYEHLMDFGFDYYKVPKSFRAE